MEELEKWQGASAQLWRYSTSHSRLVLKLRGDAGELFVMMDMVFGIWGPVAWSGSRLRVSRDDVSKEWLVRDSEAGFLVTCDLVQLSTEKPDLDW